MPAISLEFIEFIESLVDMALKLFSLFPFGWISLSQCLVYTPKSCNCSSPFLGSAPLAPSLLSRGQSAYGTEYDTTGNNQGNQWKISHARPATCG